MRLGVREWLFSANCFAAAILALFISFSLGLERPFWAMATVYITSQPLSGAVRSKAVFRLAGTVIGAVATVLMVPPLANAPVLLSLALALWVAGCQYISLLDRTPRSYLFMLAGYTAGLIGFPSVSHPHLVFETAVLRAEEVGIGVTCAALIHAAIFPRSVTGLLGNRIQTVLSEAEAWIVDALAITPPARTARERRRLAADLTELHAMAVHVPFDTAGRRPTQALLSALQDRMVLLLPLVSAVEDRIRSLSALGPPDPALAQLHEAVRAWVREPDEAVGMQLRERCAALAEVQLVGDWQGLLRLNLLSRLGEVIEVYGAARALGRMATDPQAKPTPLVRSLIEARLRRPLHLDYRLAAVSALATFVAIIGCCAFWIGAAWSDGGTAAMIAAVACCFFATMDDPVPAQRSFLIWTAMALPIVALYLFAILPRVTDFATMALVLAPALLVPGALMALPHWYGRMVPMIIGLSGGLALTNNFTPDAATFFNGNFAMLAGVAAAIVATRLFRSMGAGTAIARLRRAGWRDLAQLAGNATPAGATRWASRMLDRVGLIAARAGDATGGDRDAAAAALRELRIGMSLAQLNARAAEPLRAGISGYFARGAPRDLPPEPELLRTIDAAIDAEGGGDRQALAALTGLRRNLFPSAPAWQQLGAAA